MYSQSFLDMKVKILHYHVSSSLKLPVQKIGYFLSAAMRALPMIQESQLSQRDRATHSVSLDLVSCCTAVRKITFQKGFQ